MLASLDMIDWADLTHAYGRATDVPDQIRALRSADPGIRDKALHSLYGNIFHQGTRFEASAYAVPPPRALGPHSQRRRAVRSALDVGVDGALRNVTLVLMYWASVR